MTAAKSEEYWHGMAALRAFAMLLGVVLHSAVPFLGKPLSGLHWVYFQAPSSLCDICFWWIHVWRIPLFFFLAGFFGQMTLQRHGVEGFAERRIRRLAIPYLIAAITVGPLSYVVFHFGWYVTGQCSFDQMWPHVPLPDTIPASRFGPLHLWFLLELIILSASFAFLYAALSPRVNHFSEVERLPVYWWFPACMGLLSGLMLWSDITPLFEYHNTFLCVPARLLYNSVFFMAGIVSYRQRINFLPTTGFYRRHLMIAVPLSALFLWLRLGSAVDITSDTGSCLLSMTAGMLCWMLIYGLIGGFNEWFRRPHVIIQYLSDSSYWVYIIHLPFVAAFHLLVFDLGVSSTAKFLIVSVTTTAFCLATYQLFVRYSVVGRYLHGPRNRPRPVEPDVASLSDASAGRTSS